MLSTPPSRRPAALVLALAKAPLLLMLLMLLLAPAAAAPDKAPVDQRTFPQGFIFGCATAAYQIEGAWNESGKGENIWDRVLHDKPNWVKGGVNGDVACDSYHKYKEDVAMLADLGMDVYRFSLSWARILPDGMLGNVNKAGVDYYNALIAELLSKNIQPVVTLYHWDLPQALQDLGGWPNPVLADYFADYADLAFRLFGDRVKMWITLNEPREQCPGGYGTGQSAPGIAQDGVADYLCAHTSLLAHARAYRLYHAKYAAGQQGRVGITLNSEWHEPKNSSSEEDRLAAERALQFEFGWFAHPIFSETGDYPAVMKERVMANSLAEGLSRSRLPTFTPEEVTLLKGSADFFGLNHYTTVLTSPAPEGDTSHLFRGELLSVLGRSRGKDIGVTVSQDPEWPKSAAFWLRSVPWGFRKLLVWIRDEYRNPPVYVTENGFADHGHVHDVGRISYATSYLEQLLKAIYEDGCDVRGHMTWSLMDNLEWRLGYTARFGLHAVNFSDPARPRTPKDSVALYRQMTRTRRLPSAEETELCLAQGVCYRADGDLTANDLDLKVTMHVD
ncbi:Myrosinase 1 [Frankliniella fusca]|uniref:beta-glucosidase n=1 Tax=Frankliniella fusca TaxID=407009 RepID=A0AAE1GXP6_9NEOP|nr:Myrosinase 1 [Frankliniella fusca]